ncbi:MAG: HD domain-containing protein [Nitrosopumilaceae archaeon]
MIEEFFKITTNLKKIPRKGWKTKLGISSPESVADHTFSMSTIAMVLADIQKLDTHKVLKMSLLHDIAESIIGDLTPEDISKNDKIELENKTMNEILSNLPENLTKDYLALWNEYNENNTEEAKLVHDVDKLEMVFQALSYSNDGIERKKFEPFFNSAKNQINSNYLKEMLDKLLQ